ncbi:hypothetical protein GOARA_067_00470 [Gordonia araii NBRC 100433]|uniref:ABC transporter permease protein n=1 Tax=Gordonia araii NBRC 100433 TaxID=1073574 RepID=G7H666_9ACTN|nr:ABC transporter permease [Gordonia araii]NNG99268.1 ABC transporter permease subunit [Gordonia araii NBRC 100433]GAB11305.1 hypothetical protein GOARA_067_00470 [Gordonia araii NBRC 100433]
MLSRTDALESTSAVRVAVSTAMIPILVFALWGAYATTSEYDRGAIVSSLLIVPRRSTFYTAKLLAVAAVAATAMTVSALAALIVVVLAAPPSGVDAGPLWAVAAVGVVGGGVAVAGASAGFVLRGPITTAVALIVALLGPQALGPALGGAQRWVVGSGPGTLVARAAGSDQVDTTLGWPVGALGFVIVVAVAALAGWRVFARADH